LSIYPEDYEIQMEDLVRRWIAEGFIKVEGRRNLIDVGKLYFNELINRSMIQPLDINYNGQAKGCHVHDMILDLIKYNLCHFRRLCYRRFSVILA
jgi:hypothetical protein